MTEVEEGRVGSTLDEFLGEEGIFDEATEHGIKGVLAWQIEQAMKPQRPKGSNGTANGDQLGAVRPAP